MDCDEQRRAGPAAEISVAEIALLEILARIQSEPYHWPVGWVMVQKVAYFATEAGIPTGLVHEASSYGLSAPGLSALVRRLQDNGLVLERKRGRTTGTVVGKISLDAHRGYDVGLSDLEPAIARVVDLCVRFDTGRAELAGLVHYVATALRRRLARVPTATEVLEGVEKWKIRRDPPIQREGIVNAVVDLATQRWINVTLDDGFAALMDAFAVT